MFYNKMEHNIMKCLYSPGSNGPECKHCKDDPKKNCQWCNCHICGIKQDPDKQLLCDECDMAYHIYCLNPPLTSIPEDEDWSVGLDSQLSVSIKFNQIYEGYFVECSHKVRMCSGRSKLHVSLICSVVDY